eukprot:COSAG06_NODE_1061_length_10874_cov_7.752390_6_plen_241_part_00
MACFAPFVFATPPMANDGELRSMENQVFCLVGTFAPPDSNIIDGGAHWGETLILMEGAFADTIQIHSFERSVTLVKSSVTLLGQYDTWSVSRPNLPPFRACEHASWAVLHGTPQTLIAGNSHACPKCEPTRARPNCLHNPPSMPQRSASRDALFVNEAQLASRICQQTALTGGPTLPICSRAQATRLVDLTKIGSKSMLSDGCESCRAGWVRSAALRCEPHGAWLTPKVPHPMGYISVDN